jgi:excisionase family DNA binding protein
MENEIGSKQADENIAEAEQEAGSNGMLTAAEVARMLNVHINTVRTWSNIGILKSYRIGPRRDRRFKKEDVDRFLWK